MFDPTVFENVKVVMEGAIYELDLARKIAITKREDLIDLSTLSRSYALRFTAITDGFETPAEAELRLHADLGDLASEILELEDGDGKIKPGCSLEAAFFLDLRHKDKQDEECGKIRDTLERIWGHRFTVKQALTFDYGTPAPVYHNRITVDFGRKFGEEVIEDIANLLDHMVLSLIELHQLQG